MSVDNKHIFDNHRYQSGEIVSAYMKEPYHILRTNKAIDVIESYIEQFFSDTKKEEIRILEIAGSTGTVAIKLAQRGYSVMLSDIEDAPLAVAYRQNPTLDTIIVDASEKFPFEDSTFQVIYAGDIIEHLYDTSKFLREIYRCLVPGGIVVLTTPNLASLEDRIGFLFGKSPRQIDPTHEFLSLHIRPFTYSKLKESMESVGFSKFRLETNLIRLKIGRFKVDLVALAKVFPSIGRSLIVGAIANKTK